MYILQSWKDSLLVFYPKNLKLFLLITLKSIIETYKTLIIKFWWLIGGFIILDQLIQRFTFLNLGPIQLGGINIAFPTQHVIIEFCYLGLLFLTFLIVRPSIKLKNIFYIKDYWRHVLYFIIFTLIITYLSGDRFYMEVDDQTGGLSQFMLPGFGILQILVLLSPYIIVSPFFAFSVYFMLDSDGKFKSIAASLYKAFKMCLFNYPFCLIMLVALNYLYMGLDYILFSLLIALNIKLVTFIDTSIHMLPSFSIIKYWAMLFWPIPLCFLNNFYIKRLHEQFDVYFKLKGE